MQVDEFSQLLVGDPWAAAATADLLSRVPRTFDRGPAARHLSEECRELALPTLWEVRVCGPGFLDASSEPHRHRQFRYRPECLPIEVTTSERIGQELPLKVEPLIVAEVLADTALLAGGYRHPFRFIRPRYDLAPEDLAHGQS